MKLIKIFIFVALCSLIMGCSEEKAEVKDNPETEVVVEEQDLEKEKTEEETSEKTAAEILEEMRKNSTDETEVQEETDEVQENTTETVSNSESLTILIEDFKPSPKYANIDKGTTVIWENADNFYHMIAIYKTEHDRVQLAKGETYSYVFEDEGEYTWFSSPYPKTQGTINVSG